MHPDDRLRTFRDGGDLVDVEVRGVGGEDGSRRRDPVEIGEHLFLQVHVLEHRLDHEVGARDIGEAGAAVDPRDARPGLRLGHAALGEAGLDLLAAIGKRLVAGLGADLDQPHREAAVGEGKGDAAPHGAAADDGNLFDLACGRALREIGQAARFALGEEKVAERPVLRRPDAFLEDDGLRPQALVERNRQRHLDGVDRPQPGVEAAEAPAHGGPCLGEDLRVGPRRFDRFRSVAGARQVGGLRVAGGDRFGESDGLVLQLALDDAVDDAELERFIGAEDAGARDDVEGRLEAGDAGKPLGAAVARDDAEADLGEGEGDGLVGQAVLAGQRHLEPAAEGAGMDRGNDRLGRQVEAPVEIQPARRLLRLAELGDVGAGEEARPPADEDPGLDGRIAGDLRQPRMEAGLDGLADRVDRRIVGPQKRDGAAPLEGDGFRELDHAGAPPIRHDGRPCRSR